MAEASVPFADFHQMLRETNLLVIDHNTFRFHTYDIVTSLLLDPKIGFALSANFTDDFKNFLYCKNWQERAAYMKMKLRNLNLSYVFKYCNSDPRDYIHLLSTFLSHEKDLPTDKVHFTPTQLWTNLSAVMNRDDIHLFVLRHKDEIYNMQLPAKTRYLVTDNLFNIQTIMNVINAYKINGVILDSAEMAALLSTKVKETTFIFGDYRYNYGTDEELKFGVFRKMDLMMMSERSFHNEFGTFDPFPIEVKGVVDNGEA